MEVSGQELYESLLPPPIQPAPVDRRCQVAGYAASVAAEVFVGLALVFEIIDYCKESSQSEVYDWLALGFNIGGGLMEVTSMITEKKAYVPVDPPTPPKTSTIFSALSYLALLPAVGGEIADQFSIGKTASKIATLISISANGVSLGTGIASKTIKHFCPYWW